MTQPNSKGSDRNSEETKRLYGTQFSSFGADNDVAKLTDDTQTRVSDSQRVSAPGEQSPFGTQFAAPISQQSAFVSQEGRIPPTDDRFNAVTSTRRADPLELQRIAATITSGNTEKAPASRIRSITESEKTLILRQRSGDTKQPVGKSTWDLRIHRRDVHGQIAGIVNSIPAIGDTVTGLQSALAVDDDAPEYEILGQLGAGNMGIVYHARQLSLNRELAIKTLKPTSTQVQHDQAMFVSEAVVTANLVHPNIIPIHDLGRTEDGKLFYSMKKVSGVSWNEVIRERSLEDNLDIYMKLCDAVAYAHSRGVINRDLKPENVVVGSFGEVVVLDWGLAITTELFEKSRSVLVDFRGGAGTPVYMAPELLDEDLSRIGPPSDVYLLGAILFEILEGYPPHLLRRIWTLTEPGEQFDAVYQAVMYNEIEEDVTHHGELMQIARKAMSTEPESRFQSVETLQNAIREYRITGRAEELMNSIDSKQVSDYTVYQSAVALYGEALLKWPDNHRAIRGDRNARLAYAQLAQKKGDIDLGLQVVARHADPVFAPVTAKLKKTRLIRTIIRGTWGVTTVSAVSLLLYSWILWMQAVQAKDELVAVNGDLAEVQAKKVVAEKAADDATSAAQEAKDAADKAISDARIVVNDARDELQLADTAKKLAEDEAAKAREEAVKQSAAAKKSLADALKAKADARQAETDRKTAQEALESARAQATLALADMYKFEYEGFKKQIDAAEQLSDFNEVIRIAKDALTKADNNPEIKKNKVVLQKQIEAAEKSGGNAQIPLPNEPSTASISADGNTVLAYFGGLQKLVMIYRNVVINADGSMIPQTIPVTLKGDVKLAVSDDGLCFCLATASEIQFWRLRNDQYEQLNSRKLTTAASVSRPLKKIFFAPNGKHFYTVGNDQDATVEIYSVNSDDTEMLVRQRLTGGDNINFQIRDVALLPDESALIVQFESQKCFQFRLIWSSDGTPRFDQTRLSRNAPAMSRIEVPEHPNVTDTPEKLFVSPDGKRLGLVYGDTVVFLPEIPGATDVQFSFRVPDQSADYQLLKATLPVDEVQFSVLNNVPRVATGHRRQFLEIWDLRGQKYEPCSVEALFKHHVANGAIATCLRGHSKNVKAFTFAEGNGDKMVSVSADKSIRTWEISTYAELARQIKRLRETFEQIKLPPTVRLEVPNSDLQVANVTRSGRDATSRIDKWLYKELFRYAPTVSPLSQSPENSEPHGITQGQSVFSARFSPDASRIVIGADDLAAHVFDSQTGKEILTPSMLLGRKDLLFDPSRNMFLEGHVSEISTIRFVPPKGELLLSADYFGSISAWDAAPDEDGVGFERSRLLSEYSFSEFAVSDDGNLILAGGAETVRPGGPLADAELLHKGVLWQKEDLMNSPTPVPSLEFTGRHPQFAITAVAISPSGQRIVTAGRRGKMVVWNVADAQVIAEADGQHNHDQVSGIFFESEAQFVSSGYDGRVFRSTVEGSEITAKPILRSDGQSAPAFIIRMRPSPDRQRFATSDVALLRDATGSRNGHLNVTIWSNDGTTRLLLSQPIQFPETEKNKAFRHDVSWSSDGRRFMLVHDGDISIFDTTNWKLLRKFTCSQRGARPLRGTFAPAMDGRPDRIATFDGRVSHLWDLADDGSEGVHVAEFRSHARYGVTASYSSNNEFVATASETLRIFNADEDSPEHGATLYRLPVGIPHRSPLADAGFSPVKGDLRLATIDIDGTLALWNWIPAAAKPLELHCDPLLGASDEPDWAAGLNFGDCISWSSDANAVAALQNGVASIWRLANNAPVQKKLPLPAGFQCRFNQLQFSKTESLLTAGGLAWNESTGELLSFAAVWDTTQQMPRLIATIDKSDRMHSAEIQNEKRKGITAISMDDSSNEIVTGGADGRLIRWQMTRSEDETVPSLVRIADILSNLGTETPHKEMITAIDISSVGQILTADKGGHAILWPVPKK